ncbi:MAG: HPr family phosphocarrier protein [Clostridium sp.]|nr:HPr family phosphocarrier protein [Acetatifactor muris]MCM1527045.1 HPr family phosphocarrier protein [Bacteroides sp.]MCM1562022.1 HPr family phosphocarrier protein [Clostridium sp.]
MKEFKYTITDNEGIHARPAGELVKLAKTFTAEVKVNKDGKEADCKKIFTLMGLGAKKGHELTFAITGEDEEAACEALQKFMRENL